MVKFPSNPIDAVGEWLGNPGDSSPSPTYPMVQPGSEPLVELMLEETGLKDETDAGVSTVVAGLNPSNLKVEVEDLGKFLMQHYPKFIGGSYHVKNDTSRVVWMRSYVRNNTMDFANIGITAFGLLPFKYFSHIATAASAIQTFVKVVEELRNGLKNKGYKPVLPGRSFIFSATASLQQVCHAVLIPPNAEALANVAMNVAGHVQDFALGIGPTGGAHAMASLVKRALRSYEDPPRGYLGGFDTWTGLTFNHPNHYDLSDQPGHGAAVKCMNNLEKKTTRLQKRLWRLFRKARL